MRALIVDVHLDRATKMEGSLKACGCSVTSYRTADPDPTGDFDLVLVHYTDERPFVNGLSRRLVVYYGGAGEPDSRWGKRLDQRSGSERIWRAIDQNGTGAPTQEEAGALLTYVSALTEQRNSPLPALLQQPRDHPLLDVLAILCQGFLVALPAKTHDQAVASALIAMGAKPGETLCCAELLPCKPDAQYWDLVRDAFGSKPESVAKAEFCREADDPQFLAVNKLVVAVARRQKLQDAVVAEAYLALSERLKVLKVKHGPDLAG